MTTKLIVAGASGYIGSRLLQRLPSDRVAGLVLRRPLPEHAAPQWLFAEGGIGLRDFEKTADDLVLVHLVGTGRGHRSRDLYDTNVGATLMLIEFARKIGAKRIVYMSGFGVGPGSSSAYFQAKREAEELVAASGLEYAILRCSYVLGGKDEFRSWILEETAAGRLRIPGGADYRIQPLYIDDLVGCLMELAAAEERLANIFDFLGEPIGFAVFLERLLARLGISAEIRREPIENHIREAVKEADPTFSLDELGILLSDIVGPWTREVAGIRPRSAAAVIEAIAAEFHGVTP